MDWQQVCPGGSLLAWLYSVIFSNTGDAVSFAPEFSPDKTGTLTIYKCGVIMMTNSLLLRYSVARIQAGYVLCARL